jgi:DNA ligase D-like protein (predicted 3'-phosphoesterase)
MKNRLVGLVILLIFISGCGEHNEKKNSLTTYQEKRNFSKTPEPKGVAKKSKKNSDLPMFVIQKHEASRLHYDLRLEIGDVLVSWAIPKGPSTNPEDKRLAIQTEDHPMDYGDFEGVIPEGNYGAGPVMVWDTGTYQNIKEVDGKLVPMERCLKDGRIEIFLYGQKLQGGYALIRMKSDAKKNQWLFIKMKDEHADKRRNPVSTQNKSALTGRTMKQIEQSGDIYEG